MNKLIWVGVLVGGALGGWIGSLLDHGNMLGGWSLLLGTVGSLAGIWVCWRIAN